MKIVFMGTPQFAVPALERLIDSSHTVSLVVTQPDKKAGRGQQMQAPAVKESALLHGIEVAQPSSIRTDEFLELLRQHEPDVIVVAAYGKILPIDVLDLPRYGCINVHASLLPRYRGAAPINWAIINGETVTGVTIMQMDAGLDTGAMIAQDQVEILEDDDATSITHMLSVMGAAKLLEVLDTLEKNGCVQATPQDEALSTYAPLLKKTDGLIHWAKRTDEIICQVRGTHPWPGAYTTLNDVTFKIRAVEPLWGPLKEDINRPERILPGSVAMVLDEHGFAVRTGDGFLVVTEAQPAGKKAMSAIDLVNGKYIAEGTVLGA
jgi:methionyl-tRNA formyltransferase